MAFRETENLMPMKESADKTRMFQTLLTVQALSYFEHHLMRRLEAKESDFPDNELIELVLRDVDVVYIPKRAIRVQKYYMRQISGSSTGLNNFVQQFVERLKDLNHHHLFFLKKTPSS
jgi:hypothetical protein